MGMATVGVYKSGTRLLINIPKNVIISENIKPGALLDITIKNTGKTREKRKTPVFKKREDIRPEAESTKPVEKPAIPEKPGTFVV